MGTTKLTNCMLGTADGVWYRLLAYSDYERQVQPTLHRVIRSRGAHSPGSGNYCYGAYTIKDATARCDNDPILMPGCHIHWQNEDDSERYWVDWVGHMVYYVWGYRDGDFWVYHQCTPKLISFLHVSDDVWVCHAQTKYRVPDGFFSREWLTWEEFPWISHGGEGTQGVSFADITLEHSPYEITQDLWSFYDRFTLAYSPWINEYLSLAYVDAISKAPINRVNNVQNVVGFLTSLFRIIEAPYLIADNMQTLAQIKDALSSAWLAYRYSLSTSIGDISEMAEYAHRVAHSPQRIHCNGFVATEHEGASYEFRASVYLTPEEVNSLQSDIEKLGLGLSSYAVWDMVPYSFIADWFLHIGDKLEFYEDRNRALRLKPSSHVWYSVVRRYQDDRISEDMYFRWAGSNPTYSPTFVKHGDAKTSTIVKRVIDVLALM